MRETQNRKEGVVMESLPDLHFRVKLDGEDRLILAHLAGRLKLHRIRIVPGDRVAMELSPDGLLGRIVRRL